MYTCAGDIILQDSFEYFSPFVKCDKISDIAKKICDVKKDKFCVSLSDYIGCAAHRIIKKVADFKGQNESVFLYEDEHFANGKLTAVFRVNSKLFLFDDSMCKFKNILSLNLFGCYNHHGNGKYSAQDYNDIAQYFFEKSQECTD